MYICIHTYISPSGTLIGKPPASREPSAGSVDSMAVDRRSQLDRKSICIYVCVAFVCETSIPGNRHPFHCAMQFLGHHIRSICMYVLYVCAYVPVTKFGAAPAVPTGEEAAMEQ